MKKQSFTFFQILSKRVERGISVSGVIFVPPAVQMELKVSIVPV